MPKTRNKRRSDRDQKMNGTRVLSQPVQIGKSETSGTSPYTREAINAGNPKKTPTPTTGPKGRNQSKNLFIVFAM
jgi:hypothetical protein